MIDLPTFDGWGAVPAHLKTKTTLGKEGLRPAKGQPAAARVRTRFRSKVNVYDLFDSALAIPKRQQSDAQKAALEKAKQASLEKRTCKRCGYVEELSRHYRGKYTVQDGYCPACWDDINWESDRDAAEDWAREMLTCGALILDTETTGLYNCEIIQIAVINMYGHVLLDTLIAPQDPDRMYEVGERGLSAVDIHGITREMLEGQPAFPQIYEQLRRVIEGREVVVYNADFDRSRLSDDCARHGLEMIEATWHCAMLEYAAYVGDRRRDGDYRWQPLNGGHSALSDCFACRARIYDMANEMMQRGPKTAYEEFLEKQAAENELAYWQQEALETRHLRYAVLDFMRKQQPADGWPRPEDAARGDYADTLIRVPQYLLNNIKHALNLKNEDDNEG